MSTIGIFVNLRIFSAASPSFGLSVGSPEPEKVM